MISYRICLLNLTAATALAIAIPCLGQASSTAVPPPASPDAAQTSGNAAQTPPAPPSTGGAATPEAAQPSQTAPASPAPGQGAPQQAQKPLPEAPTPQTEEQKRSQRELAEEQLRAQKKQRILGIFPNFNVQDKDDAAPMNARQKFGLAFRTAIDPVTFAVAGFDAAISQARNEFKDYGQGMQGYGKRIGASYADQADGLLWGNAVLPSLLHQDPRYFRKKTGSFKSRLWYAVSTVWKTKNDDGSWGPNYSNLLGNMIAGGVSNVYYPPSDRGVDLTFERAATVTAYGAIGAVFNEFWPDIKRKVFHKQD